MPINQESSVVFSETIYVVEGIVSFSANSLKRKDGYKERRNANSKQRKYSMAKGGTFENEVGRDLSLLWSQGKRKNLCRRTESSGGRLTSYRKKSTTNSSTFQGGDLTFSDPDIKPLFEVFSIECKTGYSEKRQTGECVRWDLLDLFDGRKETPVLEAMWTQCVRDAEVTSRRPWLIFRRNKRKICMLLFKQDFQRFKDLCGIYHKPMIEFNPGEYSGSDKIILVNFDDFKEFIGVTLNMTVRLWNSPIGSNAHG